MVLKKITDMNEQKESGMAVRTEQAYQFDNFNLQERFT